MTHKLIKTFNYLLVVDDSEIKELDYYWNELDKQFRQNNTINHPYHKKIIAHLPLNSSPILEGVDLLPTIEDDVEQLANIFSNGFQLHLKLDTVKALREGFKEGYNKAREKFCYTEDDMIDFAIWRSTTVFDSPYTPLGELRLWESTKVSYPTEFECEMVDYTVTKEVDHSITYSEHKPKPKTTTNAQGQRVWVGKYK